MTITMNNLGTARTARETAETESWRGVVATSPAAGLRLVVDLHLITHAIDEGFWATVDHGLTTTYRSLVITGTVLAAGAASRPYQPEPSTLDGLHPLLDDADWSALRTLWTRWHAQGLSPGCSHQSPPPRADVAEALAWCSTPCPIDGYVFGSGWLVRDLPYDVQTRARQLGHALGGGL